MPYLLPPGRARTHAWFLLGVLIGLCPLGMAQSQPVVIKDAVRYDAGVLMYAGVGNSNLNDNFGQSAAFLGDLDGPGPGVATIAFGHTRDDDVDDPAKLSGSSSGKFNNNGALWLVNLDADGQVVSKRKLGAMEPDMPPLDTDNDPPGVGGEDYAGVRGFGQGVDAIGDLDGDGVVDLVVGVNEDDDGTLNALCSSCSNTNLPIDIGYGSLFVLFMREDGTIKSWQKISKTQGGGTLSALLDPKVYFGASVCSMGDFNDDGFKDILVGAPGTHKTNPITGNPFPSPLGAGDPLHEHISSSGLGRVWVLSLNPDGTVFRRAAIDLNGLLPAPNNILLDGATTDEYGDEFGRSVAWLGDIDGPPPATPDPNDPVNSMTTIAVGAPFDDDGPPSAQGRYGAVWIIGLDMVGSALKVVELKKISATKGNFHADLKERDLFGISMDPAGDWNKDGIPDLAVGAQFDDDGWANSGAVYLLMLNKNGTVKSHMKISDTTHGMPDPLITNGQGVNFGSAVANVGDFDGNGTIDFIAGAELYDPLNRGAGWLVTTDVPRMTLGDRLDADVAPDNSYTFTFEATAGTKIKMVAVQRFSGMEPALRILGPLVEGQEPEVLVDVEDSISKKDTPKARKKAKLPKKFTVPATGEYLVEVLDRGGKGGTFRMKTKGKAAKEIRKVVRDIELGEGEELFEADFDSTSGSLLKKMVIKALKPKGDFAVIDGLPADLHPALDAVMTPSDQALPIDGLLKVNKAGTAVSLKKLPLTGLGEYTAEISGVDDSVGYARLKASVKIPKGKAKIELP